MDIFRFYDLISRIAMELGITWSTHLFTGHCFHIYHLLLVAYRAFVSELLSRPVEILPGWSSELRGDVILRHLIKGQLAVHETVAGKKQLELIGAFDAPPVQAEAANQLEDQGERVL